MRIWTVLVFVLGIALPLQAAPLGKTANKGTSRPTLVRKTSSPKPGRGGKRPMGPRKKVAKGRKILVAPVVITPAVVTPAIVVPPIVPMPPPVKAGMVPWFSLGGGVLAGWPRAWSPRFSGGAGLTCRGTSFCDAMQPQWLAWQFDVAADESSNGGGLSSNPVSFAYSRLDVFRFSSVRNVRWMIGGFEFLRSTRYLQEAWNVQLDVGGLRITFARRDGSRVQGGCFVEAQAPGIKYVGYTVPGAVPFLGIHATTVGLGCQGAFGNERVSALLGITLGSGLSIGQSGDGKPENAGKFGALLSENRFSASAGLRIDMPEAVKKIGLHRVRLDARFSGFYHMNRGCLPDLGSAVMTCGNQMAAFEGLVSMGVSLDWGLPSASYPRNPLDNLF